jgi:hypothetical protein
MIFFLPETSKSFQLPFWLNLDFFQKPIGNETFKRFLKNKSTAFLINYQKNGLK